MKTKIIGLFLLYLAAIPLNAQDFYLNENGVTIMCPNAAVGDSATVFGIQYVKRSKDQITAANANTTCTSGITDMSKLFEGIDNSGGSELINLSTWDVSDVRNMSNLFNHGAHSYSLKIENISFWDVSNVTDMSDLFRDITLYGTEFSSWNVSNVTNMKNMFRNSTVVTSTNNYYMGINDWDVSNVTDMSHMFDDFTDSYFTRVHATKTNTLEYWDVSSVEDMSFMFANKSREMGDISKWDVSNVVNMRGMFERNYFLTFRDTLNPDNENIINYPLYKWDVGKVTDMSRMFNNSINIAVDSLKYWNTRNVTNMDSMFWASSAVNMGGRDNDLSLWCLEKIPNNPIGFDHNRSSWGNNYPNFGECPESQPYIQELVYPKNYDVMIDVNPTLRWKAVGISFYYQLNIFDDQNNLIVDSLLVSYSKSGDTFEVKLKDKLSDNSIYFWRVRGLSQTKSKEGSWSPIWKFTTKSNFRLHENGITVLCSDAEFGQSGLVNDILYVKRTREEITSSNIATTCTSGITDMSDLFSNTNLGTVWELGSWDVSNVTNMSNLFSGMIEFNSDLKYWDVSKVTDMSGMFSSTKFNSPLNTWDVSNVTDMSEMFISNTQFNQELSNWNVSKATNLSAMFAYTSFDKDISLWDVSNVTDMSAMFTGNTQFNQDLSSWDVSSTESMYQMFYLAESFNSNISNWNVSRVSNMDKMFSRATNFDQNLSGWCVSLIGSAPVTFSEESALSVSNLPIWGNCPDRNLLVKTFKIDSVYTKKGFHFSTSLSIDELSEEDGLISYEFKLIIPNGITYDSLILFHEESNPSLETNLVSDTLKIAVTGSSIISSHNPLMELFFTSDSIGTFNLEMENIYLNNTPNSNFRGGFNLIDSLLIGDVDNNKVINAYDAGIILHYTASKYIIPKDSTKWWDNNTWFNWRNASADVDKDGEILALDASYLLKYLVGKINEFPTYTPSVVPVSINFISEGNNQGYIEFVSTDPIFALSVDISEIEDISLGEPLFSSVEAESIINTENGYKLSMASKGNMQGSIVRIPVSKSHETDEVLMITSYTNNVKTVIPLTIESTGLGNDFNPLPDEFNLFQNYPNPFNPNTSISFSLPISTHVRIEVFNTIGNRIKILTDKIYSPGIHSINFDGANLASGVYFYRINTPDYSKVNQMMLVK